VPNYVPGIGPMEPDLMIIGEYPGKEEDAEGIPMVGQMGRLTREMVESAGMKWEQTYRTNVFKYMPPFGDVKKYDLIDVKINESIEKLWSEEINRLKPKCILLLGNEALRAVCSLDGVLNYRGSIMPARNGMNKTVTTLNPAALFPKGEAEGLPWIYKNLIQADIQRAVDESHSSVIQLPVRSLDIAHNSLDVFRFFREYEKIKNPACDIESVNCIPVSLSFAFTPYHSLTIPLLRTIGPHPLTDMSYSELAECWKIIQEIFLSKYIVGQNFKYDEFKLNKAGFTINRLISDILLKTSILWPELPIKKLHVLTSIWTREPYYKEEGKESKIGKKFDVERFFRYNGKDSCVTKEIDIIQEEDLVELGEKFGVPLKDFYYNYYMKSHKFFLKLENNGFLTNMARKAELKTTYEALKKHEQTVLEVMVGHEVNTKSYPDVYTLLYKEMKFPPRKREPTSEDTIISLLANHCKGKDAKLKAEILESILKVRRVRDQLSRQINFKPDYDGRCKSSFKITGTETGRRSTNILKKPLRPEKIGLAFHTISKHGKLGKDIRSMFVPDPGYVLIQGDLSQAEARIVAVLAEDYELLKAFDTIDVHRRTAGMFFGFVQGLILTPGSLPIVDQLEKDGPERFTGKMFRHAGNYDMGKRRAMNEFNVNAQKYEINMNISEYKAGQYIDLFHAASPKIRGVFHKCIRAALDDNKTLINPYGRVRQFFGKWDDDLYKEGYAFIPQSTVADTTLTAALEAWDEFGHDSKECIFLSENHDALVIQAPANNWEPYAKVLKKAMQREIDFNLYCTLKRDVKLTIPVDIEMSDTNYAELRKVKV
jgi:uracil-DNA glycosylase family 4